MAQQASLLKALAQRPQEYLVGLGVVLILAVMVMPIPPFVLDLLLSFSITFALIILLVECFVTRWVAMRRKTDTMPQVAFVSEGEKLSSFRDRAREMVAQVRAK